MIELTEQQAEAIERAETTPLMVNPRTGEEFVLVRKDRFEAMQKWVASWKRRWDDPADDDLIRKDARTAAKSSNQQAQSM
jgi:hypothetical protein